MNCVKIAVTGFVSVAIQFGPAIAGWGGCNTFFAHPALRTVAFRSGVGVVLVATLLVPGIH